MDKAQAVVAIAGMITGIIVTGMIVWGVVRGIRAQAQAQAKAATNGALEGEVAALRDQVDGLQQLVLESQERLDFAERLLAQSRTPEQLPRA